MKSILILIVHNVRSCHNVGSLLRTADGLGVKQVYLTGYTPYPLQDNDTRLPHLAVKMDRQIHKTALGAESMVQWTHEDDVEVAIKTVRQAGFGIAAVEQSPQSIALPDYLPPAKIALVIGNEVKGIDHYLLNQMDECLEIPMFGKKESFNVVQAAGMALYHCRFP